MTELDLPEADVLKALNEVTAAHREALMVLRPPRIATAFQFSLGLSGGRIRVGSAHSP